MILYLRLSMPQSHQANVTRFCMDHLGMYVKCFGRHVDAPVYNFNKCSEMF